MNLHDSTQVHTITAIYSNDVERMSNFYKEALNLEIIENGIDFICLGNGQIEVNILKMNSKPGHAIEPEKQIQIREETPIKCSFIVNTYDRVRKAINNSGGMLKSDEEAWKWRGSLHLDGYDPEGNVVQFRVISF